MRENVNINYLEKHVFPFADLWKQVEYRALATESGELLSLVLYLLANGQGSGLSHQIPAISPLKLKIGNFGFSKKVLLDTINACASKSSYMEIATEKFNVLGEPDPDLQKDESRNSTHLGYNFSFFFYATRRLSNDEIKSFVQTYNSANSEFNLRRNVYLQTFLKEWFGQSTDLFDPSFPQYAKLIIVAPVWIKSTGAVLAKNNLELAIQFPSNVQSSLAGCELSYGQRRMNLSTRQEQGQNGVNLNIDLMTEPKRLKVQIFCKDILIEEFPIFNRGLSNPIKKFLENRIEKKQNKMKGNELEQRMHRLLTYCNFLCYFTGKTQDSADLVSFFEHKDGTRQCFVIECSEAEKAAQEIESLWLRSNRMADSLGCCTYPIFATTAKEDDIHNRKTYAGVSLLTNEIMSHLEEMADRNEPQQSIVDFILGKIVPGGPITKYSTFLYSPADAFLSIHLDYERVVEEKKRS